MTNRAAIGLKRRLTHPDTPVFDDVVWERRDARIENWSDGSVAFEQTDVEFPLGWSQNATNIVAQKYFRGHLGTPGREQSLRQVIDRVVDTIEAWGSEGDYFVDEDEQAAFAAELRHLLVHQRMAFNSPVWFNIGVPDTPQQSSACFILSVDDEMDDILEWYVEEGKIFKGGSGSGVNLSRIRASSEKLAGGGEPSGPVSFMRGADASAGTIKSGGKTRRAAKMVILDADHPDIEEFVWTKAKEEHKARALRAAGFDMSLDGADAFSIQYQNANNSVRVSDEFMAAVEADADWDLVARTTGQVIRTVRARDLFDQIAQAAWECADPGLQYDTTINRWHTCPNSGRITASNPCFPGSAKVHTDKGLVPFAELIDRVNLGESFGIYTHNATAGEPEQTVTVSEPEAFHLTGTNPIVRLEFSGGQVLRCTPNHALWTTNRGWVAASELTDQDRVRTLDLPTPAVMATHKLPVATDEVYYRQPGDRSTPLVLPDAWTDEFAHYLGWLIGDGCMTTSNVATIYGTAEEHVEVLPRHQALLTAIGGRTPKPSEQRNGTRQLRLGRRIFKRFLVELGVSEAKGPQKTIPWSIDQAPTETQTAFLRGLFDADGCAVLQRDKGSYVGLGSASADLLRGAQRLLSALGIAASVYQVRSASTEGSFSHVRADGSEVTYGQSAFYDLRITSTSIRRFAELIGFSLPSKQAVLEQILDSWTRGPYDVDTTVSLVDRVDDGFERTYNLTEPKNHSYVVDGIVVRNCSEYLHVDDSACNLASLNLLTFLDDDGAFDVEGFRHAVQVTITAQEILVTNSHYPTDKIGENARAFRQLGLGYTNLGALLMTLGLPYDSDDGRALAATITAVMTGEAYRTSARVAARMGAFDAFDLNREPTLRVIGMHRDAVEDIGVSEVVPAALTQAAREAWTEAVEFAAVHGVRNAQVSVLAPTGTISFMMDCDTTGVEPDLALKKSKRLVGGGTMSIVNQSVSRALDRLGYDTEQTRDIIAHIDDHSSVAGAPHLKDEHVAVFACSMGDIVIEPMGHVRMMAAVQPFLSGAISKTANLPESATVADVAELYQEAWRLGVKALAIYRDNCKVAQPLSVETKSDDAITVAAESLLAEAPRPVRERLPRSRTSRTFEFRVADCKGFVTVGEYDDGRPGEIFVRVSKQGSTLAGIMDAFAIAISHGLQYGVPLDAYVRAFVGMRFEPAGMTDDPDLRIASSLIDYLFRRLAVQYLSPQHRHDLNIFTTDERMQPTLPGVEEATVVTSQGVDVEADPPSDVVAPEPVTAVRRPANDAPLCMQCGTQMSRAGSCYACSSCGNTSGCS